MENLSKLLVDLIYTSAVNKKIKLIYNYFEDSEIEDSGYLVALLTGNLKFRNIKRSDVVKVMKKNIDPFFLIFHMIMLEI